jgi:RHS repeat-associated protein
MQMPERSFSNGSKYRYGFGGKEKDNEIKGEGNSMDYGERMLDTRLGRWLSLDPLQAKYPNLSPYNFVANNPIFFIDPDGKVIRIHYMEGGKSKYYTYKPGIKPTTSNTFVQQVHQAVTAVMKNDANKTFQNISDSKETVTFNQISTNDDATKGTMSDTKVSNVSIDWNPTTGMKTSSGGAITPATALLHEAGHAERYINTDTKAEVDALKTDLKPNGTTYDNNEEKRVVDKIETPYINKANSNQPFDFNNTAQQEGTRTDHRGTTYTTTGVNSITPADGTTVTGQSKPTNFGRMPPAAIDNTRVVKPIIIPLKKP